MRGRGRSRGDDTFVPRRPLHRLSAGPGRGSWDSCCRGGKGDPGVGPGPGWSCSGAGHSGATGVSLQVMFSSGVPARLTGPAAALTAEILTMLWQIAATSPTARPVRIGRKGRTISRGAQTASRLVLGGENRCPCPPHRLALEGRRVLRKSEPRVHRGVRRIGSRRAHPRTGKRACVERSPSPEPLPQRRPRPRGARLSGEQPPPPRS